jgi:hypothetical protein
MTRFSMAPLDREALRELILRFTFLLARVPEVVEADLNPVRCMTNGCHASVRNRYENYSSERTVPSVNPALLRPQRAGWRGARSRPRRACLCRASAPVVTASRSADAGPPPNLSHFVVWPLAGASWCEALAGAVRARRLRAATRALAVARRLLRLPRRLQVRPPPAFAGQEALEIFAEIGDRFNCAATLMRMGDAYDSAAESQAAREAWKQALAILEELGHPSADRMRVKLLALAK